MFRKRPFPGQTGSTSSCGQSEAAVAAMLVRYGDRFDRVGARFTAQRWRVNVLSASTPAIVACSIWLPVEIAGKGGCIKDVY
jgi:hypothetical protein